MIEWTDEALSAANVAIRQETDGECDIGFPSLRSALDAAVQAQGIGACDLQTLLGFESGVKHGRADALEEAAEYMENTLPHLSLQEYAIAIRALKEKKG